MGSLQRVRQFGLGFLMLLCAFVLILVPEEGETLVAVALGLGLVLYGLRNIVYYLRLARHMVGGRTILIVGIIAVDAGAFALTLYEHPQVLVILYLVFTYGFMGLVAILRGIEGIRIGASWKMNMLRGIGCLLLVLVCLIFSWSSEVVILILGLAMIFSATRHIASAITTTNVIFIQ